METVRFHYIASQRILFQLQDVLRLIRYARSHPDGEVLALMDTWLGAFSKDRLIHDLDEHEFVVTIDELDKLVQICPASPSLDQLVSGQTKSTDDTEFREKLRDAYHDACSERDTRNSTMEIPWYCQPLNQIARTFWWHCRVLPSPNNRDGLITVYADRGPIMKCKFRPRIGSRTNVFEVVENIWNSTGHEAWAEWTTGSVHTLDEFIAAMDEARSLVNSKWSTWDDESKVFVVNTDGESLTVNAGE